MDPERIYEVTVNEEWLGECEFSELLDTLVKAQPGDKVEIKVI